MEDQKRDREVELEAAASQVVLAGHKFKHVDAEARANGLVLVGALLAFTEQLARPVVPLLTGVGLVIEGATHMTRWCGDLCRSATNAVASATAILQAQHDRAGEPAVSQVNAVLARMAAELDAPPRADLRPN